MTWETVEKLRQKKCVPCEGGVPPVPPRRRSGCLKGCPVGG